MALPSEWPGPSEDGHCVATQEGGRAGNGSCALLWIPGCGDPRSDRWQSLEPVPLLEHGQRREHEEERIHGRTVLVGETGQPVEDPRHRTGVQ